MLNVPFGASRYRSDTLPGKKASNNLSDELPLCDRLQQGIVNLGGPDCCGAAEEQ